MIFGIKQHLDYNKYSSRILSTIIYGFCYIKHIETKSKFLSWKRLVFVKLNISDKMNENDYRRRPERNTS